MEQNSGGITITSKNLSFWLSLISLCIVLYGVTAHFVRMESRTATLETANLRLSTEVSNLSKAVTDLTLAVRELQVIQAHKGK
jgi:uncharacterized protein YlxW (UPF0749 family)